MQGLHGTESVKRSSFLKVYRCLWEGKVDRANKWKKKMFQIGFQSRGNLKSVCKTQLCSQDMRESGRTRLSTPIDLGSHSFLAERHKWAFSMFPPETDYTYKPSTLRVRGRGMPDHTSLLGYLEDDSLLEFWLISGLKAVSHNHFIPSCTS